jgi:hypothetical protein
VTVTAFSKTFRALNRNRTGAIFLWLFLARVRLDEVSDQARSEIGQSASIVRRRLPAASFA